MSDTDDLNLKLDHERRVSFLEAEMKAVRDSLDKVEHQLAQMNHTMAGIAPWVKGGAAIVSALVASAAAVIVSLVFGK